MKDPIRPCVQEKCPNKKERTQGLIYRTRNVEVLKDIFSFKMGRYQGKG